MKSFRHNIIEVKGPKVHFESIAGTRFYFNEDDPTSGPYPSVTSVLKSPEKEESLRRWREKVGLAEATKISRQAACRGNRVHLTMENYILGQPDDGFMGEDAKGISLQIKKLADAHIDNIRAVEQPLWSDFLRVAGTPDLVVDWNGRISIIDWKNSIKIKKEEWITDYFIQEAAYAVMWEENTGIPVDQLVTVIGNLEGAPQVFINKRDDWMPSFLQLREEFDLRLLETLVTD